MRASRCTRTGYHGGGPGETSPLPSVEAPGPPGAQTAEPYGSTSLPASSHQVGRAPGLRTILDQIQDLLPNLTSSYLYSPLLCHIPSCTSALSLLGVFLTCIHPYIEVLKPSMSLYPSHRAHPEPTPHAHLAHSRAMSRTGAREGPQHPLPGESHTNGQNGDDAETRLSAKKVSG